MENERTLIGFVSTANLNTAGDECRPGIGVEIRSVANFEAKCAQIELGLDRYFTLMSVFQAKALVALLNVAIDEAEKFAECCEDAGEDNDDYCGPLKVDLE